MKINNPGSKLAKNEFRCFHCRQVIANKNGDWVRWKDMEVHLCAACEKLTSKHPERSSKSPQIR